MAFLAHRIRPVRFWPLIFSAVAFWPLWYLFPDVYDDIRFSIGIANTDGWYADFEGDYSDSRGRPQFLYAYTVKGITYGGRGLYDDDTSEVYLRKPGDRLPSGVTYLVRRPWISTMKFIERDLQNSMILGAIPFLIFCSGFALAYWPSKGKRQLEYAG